jgi:hypothetical protein
MSLKSYPKKEESFERRYELKAGEAPWESTGGKK